MKVERVQAIASSALSSDTIPAEFIRSDKEKPAITTFQGQAPAIPTIDLGGGDAERPEQKDTVVRAIADACRDWGLFQVVNHGIPDEVIARLQAAGKEFFELPQEEKEVYAKPPDAKDMEGYGTKSHKDPDGKKAWVDHLFHRILPLSRVNHRFWPQKPPSYREASEEYAKHIKQVADKLMTYLSLGLGLEAHMFKEALGGEDLEYMLKINYYPPCPRPDLTLGVLAHTDLSSLTILVPNKVPGLQVFKDDCWIDAKYIPHALIVHIGDQIEALTNGEYKSVLHRTTVAKDKARMSWPVFLEPPADFVVGPLPQLVNQDNPPKYKAKKFKDYAYCKLNKLLQ